MLVTIEQVLALLTKKPQRYQPLINFISNYPIRNVGLAESTLLIRGTSDRDWVYICSPNSSQLSRATALLAPDDLYYALLADWMVPIITKGREIEWQITSRRLILPLTSPLPVQNTPTTPLRPEETEFSYFEERDDARKKALAERAAHLHVVT
jgi:hypothetical protein